ncbi:hypothetical protein LCGC14_1368800 [marine sediment metagenome]|uniref:Uncharacterized protein n=1 Tax=marine sediment metagenome TaxID=412755 RepID=A0A0F9KRY6_9ZZZZ
MKKTTKLVILIALSILYLIGVGGRVWFHYNEADVIGEAAHAQRYTTTVEAELEVERARTEEVYLHVAWLDYELTQILAEPECVLNFEEMRSGAAGGLLHTQPTGYWKGTWEILFVRTDAKHKGKPLSFCTGRGWPMVPE